MDKSTGKEITAGGKTVTAEASFTAEKEDGTIEVVFSFDASGLGGKTVVVFEDLYHAEKKVTSHADLNDQNQAVLLKQPSTPQTVTPTPSSGKSTTTPKTGDSSNMALWGILLAAAAAACGFVLFRKRKSSR